MGGEVAGGGEDDGEGRGMHFHSLCLGEFTAFACCAAFRKERRRSIVAFADVSTSLTTHSLLLSVEDGSLKASVDVGSSEMVSALQWSRSTSNIDGAGPETSDDSRESATIDFRIG